MFVQSPLLGEVCFRCIAAHNTPTASTDPLLGNPRRGRGAGARSHATPTATVIFLIVGVGYLVQLPSWANPGQIVWCGWGKDQWWPALVRFFPYLLNRILALRAMVQLV